MDLNVPDCRWVEYSTCCCLPSVGLTMEKGWMQGEGVDAKERREGGLPGPQHSGLQVGRVLYLLLFTECGAYSGEGVGVKEWV